MKTAKINLLEKKDLDMERVDYASRRRVIIFHDEVIGGGNLSLDDYCSNYLSQVNKYIKRFNNDPYYYKDLHYMMCIGARKERIIEVLDSAIKDGCNRDAIVTRANVVADNQDERLALLMVANDLGDMKVGDIVHQNDLIGNTEREEVKQYFDRYMSEYYFPIAEARRRSAPTTLTTLDTKLASSQAVDTKNVMAVKAKSESKGMVDSSDITSGRN